MKKVQQDAGEMWTGINRVVKCSSRILWMKEDEYANNQGSAFTTKQVRGQSIACKLEATMNDIENYIQQFPEDIQDTLRKLRRLILAHAPEAEELMVYGMPGYKTNRKPLVYFAAFKSHIGFYATPSAHSEFSEELSKYKQGKGSVQFPLDQPIPYGLIERLVKFKMAENEDIAKKGG